MCQSIERDDLVCCATGEIGVVIAIVGEGEQSPYYYLMLTGGRIVLVTNRNSTRLCRVRAFVD